MEWRFPQNLLSFLIFVCIASAAFRTIGLIIAAVVNSTQESNILIQPIYMVMLFFSGATIPISFFPNWLQLVTQFVPATYVVIGLSGILQRGETLAQNSLSVLVLIITAFVGIFIATKLFRWEKEEKLRASAKLWVLIVLLPFFLLGGYQAWSRQDLTKNKILERERARGRTWLIQNARIFVGNGKVIESGAVLIRKGKIETVYEGSFPEAKTLNAEAIDAAGKTLLPGLIDMHVHLGSTGGFYDDWSKFDPNKSAERELEAYLYCGVTAVRSAGDRLDDDVKSCAALFGTGEKLGTELFFCRPALHHRRRTRHRVREVHARKHSAPDSMRNFCAFRKRRKKRASRSTISPREKCRCDQGNSGSGRARLHLQSHGREPSARGRR